MLLCHADDVATAARLGDALESLTIVGAMADRYELPVSIRCVEVLIAPLTHTVKPVTFWYHDRASARWLGEVMIALRGSEALAAQYPPAIPSWSRSVRCGSPSTGSTCSSRRHG